MSAPTRRVWVRYLGAGAALYVVFLIVTLPAQWVGVALERAGGASLRLLDPSGTVWRGEGVLVPAASGAAQRLPRVAWRLSPLWLFAGRVRLSLASQAADVPLRAQLTVRRGVLVIDDLDAALPARLAPVFYAPAALFEPGGSVRLEAQGFEIRDGSLLGDASATWQKAELGSLSREPAGSYRLQMKALGNRAELRLATVEGDLRLSGQGEWNLERGGMLRMRGTAELDSSRSDLEVLMPLLGRDRGDGQREFSIVWPLRAPRIL